MLCSWIKFEEQLDIESNRWSKPHIPTPSLQELFELRTVLREALVILDLEAEAGYASLLGKEVL